MRRRRRASCRRRRLGVLICAACASLTIAAVQTATAAGGRRGATSGQTKTRTVEQWEALIRGEQYSIEQVENQIVNKGVPAELVALFGPELEGAIGCVLKVKDKKEFLDSANEVIRLQHELQHRKDLLNEYKRGFFAEYPTQYQTWYKDPSNQDYFEYQKKIKQKQQKLKQKYKAALENGCPCQTAVAAASATSRCPRGHWLTVTGEGLDYKSPDGRDLGLGSGYMTVTLPGGGSHRIGCPDTCAPGKESWYLPAGSSVSIVATRTATRSSMGTRAAGAVARAAARPRAT